MRRITGDTNHPRILIGMPQKKTKEIAVRQVLVTARKSSAPMCWEIRILTAVPMPRKMHSSTSTGWELVPTAAIAVWSQ